MRKFVGDPPKFVQEEVFIKGFGTFAGRATTTDCKIEDPTGTLAMVFDSGGKLSQLRIGNYFLYGIMPYERDGNIFSCHIDYFKQNGYNAPYSD